MSRKKRSFRVFSLLAICALLFASVGFLSGSGVVAAEEKEYQVIAYVTPWNWKALPDASKVTAVNYCFASVNLTSHRAEVSSQNVWWNPTAGMVSDQYYLNQLVAWKAAHPGKKLLLSIGGASADGFSQAAETAAGREAFAQSCLDLINQYNLDGVDIDWETPVNGGWGTIRAIPEDKQNCSLLMKALREKIGPDKWITYADGCTTESATWVEYAELNKYIDYFNMMSYCFASGYSRPAHDGNLFNSPLASWSGSISAHAGVQMHLTQGIPAEKIIMGAPFFVIDFNRRTQELTYDEVENLLSTGQYKEEWDDTAKASYLSKDGQFAMTYESPRAIQEKAKYIKQRNLGGMMYWEYGQDDSYGTLRTTVWNALNKSAADPAEPLKIDRILSGAYLQSGQKTSVTVRASGGTGELGYSFYLLKDGRIHYMDDRFLPDSSFSYAPRREGTYQLLVFVQDSTGKIVSSTTTLTFNRDPIPQKLIALTFDDGPGAYTEQLLDILKTNNAKATFFLIGNNIAGRTSTLQRMAAEGHQIGNHTMSHQDLTPLSEAQAIAEIDNTSALIESVTGKTPTLLRAPFLSIDNRTRTLAAARGMALVNYTPPATEDYVLLDSDKIVQSVLYGAQDGGIILLHDIYATTVDAVPEIIAQLKAQGFGFVTVQELFALKGKTMVPGRVYASTYQSW